MEYEQIKALLEKYWLAETSLEEEQLLAEYFRRGEVDAEFMPYRAFFDYVEEENNVSPGEDLEAKILARVGLTGQAPVRRMNIGYAVAAALMLCVGSLFVMVQLSGGGGGDVVVRGGAEVAAIKDTYDDPEKALAAVRKALLVASAHINEGKDITEKNMDRLNNSWQTASFK